MRLKVLIYTSEIDALLGPYIDDVSFMDLIKSELTDEQLKEIFLNWDTIKPQIDKLKGKRIEKEKFTDFLQDLIAESMFKKGKLSKLQEEQERRRRNNLILGNDGGNDGNDGNDGGNDGGNNSGDDGNDRNDGGDNATQPQPTNNDMRILSFWLLGLCRLLLVQSRLLLGQYRLLLGLSKLLLRQSKLQLGQSRLLLG